MNRLKQARLTLDWEAAWLGAVVAVTLVTTAASVGLILFLLLKDPLMRWIIGGMVSVGLLGGIAGLFVRKKAAQTVEGDSGG